MSRKRLNRIELKNDLLSRFWKETPRSLPQSYDTSDLLYSTELMGLLDGRLILLEEIKLVIDEAEKSMSRLRNSSGHYVAHLKIGIITIWVEYSLQVPYQQSTFCLAVCCRLPI